MKFWAGEYIIDSEYDTILRNKRATFQQETKTKKTVHLTMVTTFGVKHNKYSGGVQSQVTLKDLFQ